jgi:hypothetical protein
MFMTDLFLVIIYLLLKIYRNNFILWLAVYVYLETICDDEFYIHWFHTSNGFLNYQ